MSKANRLNTPKTGGRKKGQPNRKTQALIDKAMALKCDPFEILCYFATGNWKALGYKEGKRKEVARYGDDVEVDVITPDMRMSAAKDLCQYLYPKRKAIEVEAAEDSEPMKFVVLWGDENENGNAPASPPDAASKAH